MNSQAYAMNNYSFRFPDYSEGDWSASINNAEGITKDILAKQLQMLSLLKSLTNREVTPARLAWVNLWTKYYTLLDSVMSTNSIYTLNILGRSATEIFLYCNTIAEPLLKTNNKNKEELLTERLCAYTAWSLSADENYVWECMKKTNLDMLWNPEPARSIICNPKKYEIYKELYGEINVDIDQAKLRNGRKKQEDELKYARNRIKKWLEHPALITWYQKIREHNQRKTPNLSFFALFNEDEKTIRKKMISIGLGPLFLSYKKASLLIHGSTFEEMYYIDGNKIMPKIQGNVKEIESHVEEILGTCQNIYLHLVMIRKYL